MAFRKHGIYSIVAILLAGLSNPQLFIPVQAEADTCDCTDQCAQLVTQSKDSLKVCNANLSKTEKAKVKALAELDEWESKKSTYASLFARKEKELSALQTQAKEAKNLSEHYQSELAENEILVDDLKINLGQIEQAYNDLKTEAQNEKKECIAANNELSKNVGIAEQKIENLLVNFEELQKDTEDALSNLDRSTEENQNLAKEIAELQNKLKSSEQSVSTLSEAQDEMKKNYDDVRRQIATSTESNDKLTKENSDLLKKYQTAETSISSLTQTQENMEKDMKNVKESLQKSEDDNKAVNEKLKNSEQIVVSLEKKSESLTTNLKTTQGKLADLESAHKNLKENLAETEMNYNNAQLSIDELESERSRKEKSYKNKQNKWMSKIEKLEKELSKVQKEADDYREKHTNARKEISILEKELHEMHRNAVSSYVNRTLLIDDISHFFDRHIDKAVSAGEKATKKTGDYSATVKTKLLTVLDKVREKSDPHVGKAKEMYSKHAQERVQSTRNLAQNVYKEHAAKHVDIYVFPLWKSYGEPVLTRVLEALESTRLSMVSGIDMSSNTVISYIDGSKDEEKTPHNPLVKRVYNMAVRVNKNAAYIVNRFITITSIFLGVFFFGSFVISSLFTILFLPYYIFRYMFLPIRKKKLLETKVKKENISSPITLSKIRQQHGIKEERPSQ